MLDRLAYGDPGERLEIEANIARVMGAIVRSIERSTHADQTR
jgi:hypothetical protein